MLSDAALIEDQALCVLLSDQALCSAIAAALLLQEQVKRHVV
jgi:hypothetical protein